MSRSPGLVAIAMLTACVQPQCDIGPIDFGFGGPWGSSCPNGSDTGAAVADLTPPDLAWYGASSGEVDLFGPTSTLDIGLGGSAAISVLASDGTPFSLAYVLQSERPSIVAVTSEPSEPATVAGVGAGDACIDIVDPSSGVLYGGLQTGTAPLLSAAVVPSASASERIGEDFSSFAFAAGEPEIAVAYYGDYGASGPRLIDLGATLVLDRATQLDWQTLELDGATAGAYSFTATIGSASATASVEIVDRETGTRYIEPLGVQQGLACFAAETDGAFIVGLEWSFTVGGRVTAASANASNCVAVPSDGATHAITALAGGQSIAIAATAQ
ncbi:MAG TPA: hypothetical protein VGG28_06860 [Kofleriaceae bacterium]|jgi:hypothetical protein